ncbi:unnamed protein product [Caenorhabditis auriculariae]|uniref:EGF-like domain-containing protein n=1 Tax=Caenorhabditis auriculariae TaxID=2777116 RepID=A0A8S1HIE4_9PELO|nr:unnamed protein product [Caenorhabditis auriculariae]
MRLKRYAILTIAEIFALFSIVRSDKNLAYSGDSKNIDFYEKTKVISDTVQKKNKPFWTVRSVISPNQVVFQNPQVASDTNGEGRFRTSVEGDWLYAFGLQQIHDGTILECWLPIDSANTTFAISRTRIEIQNCSTESSNPCQYGKCIIENGSFSKLSCLCFVQYTGFFCEKMVDGATFYEAMFILPLILFFPALLLVVIFLYSPEAARNAEATGPAKVLLLTQHIVSHDRSLVSKKELFDCFLTSPDEKRIAIPVSFLTPTSIAPDGITSFRNTPTSSGTVVNLSLEHSPVTVNEPPKIIPKERKSSSTKKKKAGSGPPSDDTKSSPAPKSSPDPSRPPKQGKAPPKSS